jgi:UDP-GlcNAc:undecaprenyl-phosphate GlcNAc-1-phosphate transferase
MIVFALAVFVLGLLLSAALTPLARRMAIKQNFVAPVRSDRLHVQPTPYGGGWAIWGTLFFVSPILIQLGLLAAPSREAMAQGQQLPVAVQAAVQAIMVMSGACLFFMFGAIDDKCNLSAKLKLPVELAMAALVVWLFGVKATLWLTIPHAGEVVSVLWIVTLVNAYNMLDHADGTAAATGAVALIALAAGQMLMGAELMAVAPMLTAGALAGFLIYNYPPAKIFMGDAGSMFIGFLLAALTIQAQYYHEGYTPSRLVVLIPLAILAVPLFDMVCVTLSRIRRGESPFRGDATSHLAHRMLARGWSPRGIVALAAGASAVTGGASVAMYFLSGPALLLPWLAVAAVLAAMLVVRRPPRAGTPQSSS